MSASSVRTFLALGRWRNASLAAAGVVFGAWWAGWARPAGVVCAALAAVGFTFAANAWNDVCDAELDRHAHPERPIPAERVRSATATRFAGASLVAAVGLATAASPDLGLASVPVAASIIAYSLDLKRRGLPGNLMAAVLASLPFLYGAWAAGRPAAGLPLVAIAIPLHLARELAKDLDDADADRGYRRTVPIRWGPRWTTALLAVALLLFVVQIVPVARTLPWLAELMIPAFAFAVMGLVRAARGLPDAPRALKGAMVCTMAAFVLARAPWR